MLRFAPWHGIATDDAPLLIGRTTRVEIAQRHNDYIGDVGVRTIGVVTTSRADYKHLPLLKRIK